jgi:ribose transport system permease protein
MDKSKRIRSIIGKFGIFIALLLEIILFSCLSPFFFTTDNILNVTLQTSITAIIAAGMTFVILTAGIDLSVGAMVAFSGVIATSLLKLNLPFAASFLLAVAVGLGIGAFSGAFAGLFITRFNITPFIVTLALMTIWRGSSYIYTDGRPIWGLPDQFGFLGNTNKIILLVYVISGTLAAISGIILASRMNSGQPNAGLMYEMDAIAAVVVGGTSLFGGRGSIVGTFFGAMLIGVLRNGLNLLNVGSYVQMVVLGAVILLAVMLDQMRIK